MGYVALLFPSDALYPLSQYSQASGRFPTQSTLCEPQRTKSTQTLIFITKMELPMELLAMVPGRKIYTILIEMLVKISNFIFTGTQHNLTIGST